MRFTCLIYLFISFSSFARPSCGLQGTIEERIKECAHSKGGFALVAVSEKGAEFYKDLKAGLIWGARLSTDFNHFGSEKACSQENSEYQSLNLKWRLPTIREFEVSAANGMMAALPNSDHAYWTSTRARVKRVRRRRAPPAQVYIWDGVEQKVDTGDLKDAASVRCVARE